MTSCIWARATGVQLTADQAEHQPIRYRCSMSSTASEACCMFPRRNGRGIPNSLNTQNEDVYFARGSVFLRG